MARLQGRHKKIFCSELACLAETVLPTVAAMKNSMKVFTLAGALLLVLALKTVASTPEQEKAFTDKYKVAMENKDTATLESFLTHKAQTQRPSSFTK